MTDETRNELSEEERLENLKKIMGDDAEKYFAMRHETDSVARAKGEVTYGLSKPTKVLIWSIIAFVVVMIAVTFAFQATQSTEINIEPGKAPAGQTSPTNGVLP